MRVKWVTEAINHVSLIAIVIFSVFMSFQHVFSTSNVEHPDTALQLRSDGACVGGCLAQQVGLFKAHLG